MSENKYYVGLDCGTSSVGWAVTDEYYHILRAKGKSMWGSRLFDEAETAADRRVKRSTRRRNRRARNRIKLLNQIFSEEIAKVDPDFFIRLRESFFLEEDKEGLAKNSKNTLFNDENFDDKDFHKKYPTIWHLRQAIVKSEDDEHFDIRLYYLAIHHILKNRGHFLYEGKMSGAGNFSEIYQELVDIASNYDICINDSSVDEVERILNSKQGKIDKAKELKNIMFIETDDVEDSNYIKRAEVLAKILVGSKVKLKAIFEDEVEKDAMSFSFSESYDDKLPEIEQEIGTDRIDLMNVAKKIYDYVLLNELLGGNDMISDAMVNNYAQHKKDLAELKKIFKPYKESYDILFKTLKCKDDKTPCYNAYINKAYTEDKNGRKKTFSASQEDLNKQIVKELEKCGISSGEIYDRAAEGKLLPRQRGQAKGTIPQQLHHNELVAILEKLGKDYPSFIKEVSSEDKECNTKLKKIERIHDFRIPYYCGPLVSKKKSQFSWADDEISELVYPWNFEKLVNVDDRANKFIKRMTNACTYLIGEDVLPKNSLLYQKYMVLNELNNLKINGHRIDDIEVKKQIFEKAFVDGELLGNITIKSLKKWMLENGYLKPSDEFGGTSETKFLPKLSTHRDFIKALGVDYTKKYSEDKLEQVVDYITVLGQEKKMLKKKIQELLQCTDDEATRLSKLNYKDWGRFSRKLLVGIRCNVNGTDRSIIDSLYETNLNFMELLSGDYEFRQKIDEFNNGNKRADGKITYSDVEALYCSPAVKRTVWQALKIVNEISKVKKTAPEKIFIEVTRGEDEKQQGNYTVSRHKQMLDIYKSIKTSESKELLEMLESTEPRKLQQKKLYLYFTQMGKCAYTGEPIDLERLGTNAYNIEHIYPRSKTKDDSIQNNLVLVKQEKNLEKLDEFPIDASVRGKMHEVWKKWLDAKLITKEKYARLTRSTPLTADELGNFIARQIVETSQSVKAIRDLLKQAYPETKIVLVKARQVSEFRDWFGLDKVEKETGRVVYEGKPEFVKVRAINDFHHAKDAYLNIVVGNVMSETFTDNPFKWVKAKEGQRYSITPKAIFREEPGEHPWVKGWGYKNSIETISQHLKRNDCLWTRMNYIESGAMSDLMLVGKAENSDGILPIKKQDGDKYNPSRYGGYRSLSIAHFALIECKGRRDELQRRIVPIPYVYRKDMEQYVADNYGNDSRILIPVIGFKSLIKIDGFSMHISRKGSDVAIGFYHAIQTIFSPKESLYIKKLVKVSEKDARLKGKYEIDEERDCVNVKANEALLDAYFEKLNVFRKMPELGGKVDEIIEHKQDFMNLDLKKQCLVLVNFLNIFACSPVTSDLSSFVPKAGTVGKGKFNDNVLKYDSVLLVHQSVTGLFEKVIDLKTV